jgi:Zn-dependent protease with chaperone function
MERSRYVELERRLERLAEERPRAYRTRALLLALVGYGYIAFVVTVILLAVILLTELWPSTRDMPFWLKVGSSVLGIFIVFARALWVRMERPDGIRLRRSDAPRLFDELEALRRALRAPRVHRVLLTDEYNAAVTQVPRLGVLGWWYRNYLIVGYPLLAALTREETRAVLAHELAHLSRAHSRLTAWIYRTRQRWFQLVHALEGGQQNGVSLFKAFIAWYTPQFGAYSMVLARRHEFEADRLAATVVGADAMADALVALRLRGRAIQADFWTPLSQQPNRTPEVPRDVFEQLAERAAAGVDDKRAVEWLDEELRAATEVGETHPSLAARIGALVGESVAAQARAARAASSRAGRAAAAEYLGPTAPRCAASLRELWAQRTAEAWRQQYEQHGQASRALAELPEGDAETVESLWKRAVLTRDVHGPDAALPVVEQLLRREPNHGPARFALGMALLGRGDETGIAHVEFAMARDHEAVLPGCELVRDYLVRAGRADEGERYVARAWAQLDTYNAARAERSQLTARDTFVKHTLSETAVAAIMAQLRDRPRLGRALLVDKVVKHIPEEPVHVLVLVPSIPLWAWLWPAKEQQIAVQLLQGLELPDDTWAFVLGTEQSHVRGVVAKVPGAEIYRKPRRRDRAGAQVRPRAVPTPTRPSQSVA